MTTPVNVQRTASPKARTDDATLKFGTVFTDHMFLEDYDARQGWVNGRIEPYHHLSLDPAAAVLHYGQEIFERNLSTRTSLGTSPGISSANLAIRRCYSPFTGTSRALPVGG